MFYKISKIYRPEIFQGKNRTEHYFEGWYLKLVDQRAENVYALIPGISISPDKGDRHAFIQVINGREAKAEYLRFDFSEFRYAADRFEVKIADNMFSSRRVVLKVDRGTTHLEADLQFDHLNPWPKSLFFPGAMGWYAFVPKMECYHGVVSMDHGIKGQFHFGSKRIDFTGGRGYIEKDWGTSFPQGWVWLQSNHFHINGAATIPCSVMLSIAKIPWRGKHFNGFICGFLYGRKHYVFATYNRTKLKELRYTNRDVQAVLENNRYGISISASRQNSATLLSPVMGAMDGRIAESIDASVQITLYKKPKKGKRLVLFDAEGRCGGLEIANPHVLG